MRQNTPPAAPPQAVPLPAYAASRDYAARGWRVLPLRGKVPALSNWPEHASTDHWQRSRWFADGRFQNIGIAHGPHSGTLVLDVDGPAGEQSLAALEAELGPLPATAEVRSGRDDGGRHLFYAHPAASIGNSPLGEGLDVRAEGGQTVAPPSIHPLTGAPYAWLRHPDELPDGRLPALPAAWVALLERAGADGESRAKARGATGASRAVPLTLTPLSVEQIEAIPGLPESAVRTAFAAQIGRRSEACFRFARSCAHAYFRGAKQLDQVTVARAMLSLGAIAAHCHEQKDPAREALRIVDLVYDRKRREIAEWRRKRGGPQA